MKKLSLLFVPLLWIACGGGGGSSDIRLVDVFDAASVEGAPASPDAAPMALWDFSAASGDDPLLGWKAGRGIADLKVVNGKLTGRATEDFPILYAKPPATVDASDLFHSLVVTAKTSEAAEIRAHLAPAAEPNFESLARVNGFTWLMEGRLDGEKTQTVTLSFTRVQNLGAVSYVLLRPADKAGETFEIDSIRMVSQRENRASIPSGVGWQGLSELFRETIVSRSPESFTLDVNVPANAWLDLNVGTVEEAPLTFRIDDVSGAEPKTLLTQTVTTPQRWEDASIDLANFTGARRLKFWLDVADERRIGFWGSPSIRVRGGKAKQAEPVARALGGGEAPQGVILIMIDTLRKDHLNAYGYELETAPNLAHMAAEGTLFLDNISQATWTKVSTPSIMTSLYPTTHGVKDVPDRLPASAVTIAEVFRDAGYATAGLSSNDFTGRFTNLHQGFERVNEAGSLTGAMGTKTARPVIDRAVKFIEEHRESPFYMFVHLYDPHSDFEARPPYNTMWSDPAGKEEHEKERKAALDAAKKHGKTRQFNHLPHVVDFEEAHVDPKEWMKYEASLYDGSIRGADAEIGRLLERLRMLGLEQRTMIAVIADHGEELHDHGKMGHGLEAYGEVSNVPLILYRPGVIPAGVKVEEMTRSIDLMPTLLDLAGLRVPEAAQGESLLPLVAAYRDNTGDAAKQAAADLGWQDRPAVVEEHKRDPKDDDDDESYVIVLDGWKLIDNVQTKSKPEFELFDHAADPLDAHNVAEENPDKVEALKTELSYWRRMVTDAKLPDDASTEGMSSEELEKLRSLGYIQ